MNKKQSFHQWINQKPNDDVQAQKKRDQDETDFQQTNYDEQAATQDSSPEEDTLPVYTRMYKIDHTDQKRHLVNLFRLKPLAWAGLSAVVIGLSMGFFMLFIMGGFADDDNSQNAASGQMTSSNNNGSNVSEQRNHFELKPITAFVLQGGVFNKPDNAESIQNAFEEAGYTSVMWERDEQMHLFTGVASTKTAAKDLIGDEEDIPDVYVKEWQTDKISVDTNKDTFEWLVSLRDQLLTSMQNVSENKDIDESAWKSLKNNNPNEDKQYDHLYEKVEMIAQQISDSTTRKQQGMLLDIWKSLKNTAVN